MARPRSHSGARATSRTWCSAACGTRSATATAPAGSITSAPMPSPSGSASSDISPAARPSVTTIITATFSVPRSAPASSIPASGSPRASCAALRRSRTRWRDEVTQISELPASAQIQPGRRARVLANVLESAGVPCEIVLPDRTIVRCGEGAPTFRVTINDESALRAGTDELALGAAYVEGKIDIEGDLLSVFDVRSRLADRTPWMARLNFLAQLLQKPTSMNKKAIG